eukprot:GHVT01032937.1.p1 GENE.GHVT01032937.1~~GHVT01032937.1.p1  ORF type:complete len:447 (+),score=68.31 GHVT01032937.1:1510-2850(+)
MINKRSQAMGMQEKLLEKKSRDVWQQVEEAQGEMQATAARFLQKTRKKLERWAEGRRERAGRAVLAALQAVQRLEERQNEWRELISRCKKCEQTISELQQRVSLEQRKNRTTMQRLREVEQDKRRLTDLVSVLQPPTSGQARQQAGNFPPQRRRRPILDTPISDTLPLFPKSTALPGQPPARPAPSAAHANLVISPERGTVPPPALSALPADASPIAVRPGLPSGDTVREGQGLPQAAWHEGSILNTSFPGVPHMGTSINLNVNLPVRSRVKSRKRPSSASAGGSPSRPAGLDFDIDIGSSAHSSVAESRGPPPSRRRIRGRSTVNPPGDTAGPRPGTAPADSPRRTRQQNQEREDQGGAESYASEPGRLKDRREASSSGRNTGTAAAAVSDGSSDRIERRYRETVKRLRARQFARNTNRHVASDADSGPTDTTKAVVRRRHPKDN